MSFFLTLSAVVEPPVPPSSVRVAASTPPNGKCRWRVTLKGTQGLVRNEYVVLADSELSAIRAVEELIFPFTPELFVGAYRTDVG